MLGVQAVAGESDRWGRRGRESVLNGSALVLVVDDEDDIRGFLESALENEGYEVVQAANGLEALHLLEAGAPELILLDMDMPVMDGREFAEAYRHSYNPQVPIVVMSARPSAARTAASIGACCYLNKPFDLDELLQVANGIVRGGEAVAAGAGADVPKRRMGSE